MAATPASSDTEQHDKTVTQVDEEQKYVLQVGWKVLFSFTTKEHLPVLFAAILSATLAAATMPVFSVVYGLIFNVYSDYGGGKLDNTQFLDNVATYCLILTGIASLNWITNSVYFFFFLTFGELQAKSARKKIFDALIRKDMAWYDTRESGIVAFLPAVQMHIRDLQLSMSAPIGEGIQCIVQSLGALGVAFYYSWNLTLVVICTVPLIYLVQAVLSSRLSVRAHEQADQLQRALKHITNAIQNIEIVKCFNGEGHELQNFRTVTSLSARLYKRVANLRSLQIGIMQFFTLSVFVQGFWYGSHLVHSENKDTGQIITTFWAALMAIQGITGFLPQFIVLQKGKLAGAKLQMLLKQISNSDQQQELQGDVKPAECPGDIEFRKQVTFSYPTRADETAIRDVSLKFPAGETTFVVGRSGSGKSTLGQLLVRFYQPSSGQVLLDGVALNDLDVQWLREHVTLVEQHSVLFNDTIRQNISLGKRNGRVSLDEVKDAVSFAMLDQVVQDLPDGLETHLGMKGDSLSGGQKQRMALARARVRDAPVLVLDESTSALDYITRGTILQAIREWRRGKTTIVITHDISQIRQTDFLYLLDKAQLVQQGYRKDLENKLGAFQAFLASHREEEEDDTSNEASSGEEGETDELESVYDELWDVRPPRNRPLSAVILGESILSSFFNQGRASWAGSVVADPVRRLTRAERGETADAIPLESIDLTRASGAPSDVLSSAPTAYESMGHTSKRTSMASYRAPQLGTPSNKRRSSLSKEFGLRPTSTYSSRPTSRHITYPRRLSIADAHFSRVENESKPSKRRGFRSKMRSQRQRKGIKGQGSSSDSLPLLEIFKSVWPTLNWRSRLILFGALIAALVHAAATPIFAWVFAQLLQTFYTPDQTQKALKWALSILGIAVADGIASYLVFFLFDIVAQSWTHALKMEAMKRILIQPREFFDREENSTSRLAETLDHFAEEARNLPGRFAGIVVVMVFMVVISVVWSMLICWKLALVALGTGPILYAITQGYNMVSTHWEGLSNEASDNVGQLLHETFINIRTVRCLVLEDVFREKYKAATITAANVGIKRALYSGCIFGLNFAGVLFVTVLLFWYGAYIVSRGEYTVSAITETFLTLMLSVNYVNYIGNYITQINISREAGSRLLRLARLPETSHESTGTIRIQTAGDVTLNNVSFTYPSRKEHPVLHGVSFSIPRGSCTAIVGSSGSGKSTIASLLLKLYQADSNILSDSSAANFTVSDHDIKALHTSTLRSRMAIVSQIPTLFPGTIADNIIYGLSPSSPQASPESIKAAADSAGISEFIDSLPQGYRTLVGEGGTSLSGGQAQRVAIARALVRDPDILILDEATSALDVASASVVRETIRRLVQGGGTESVGVSPRSRSGGVWDDKDWEAGFGSGGSGAKAGMPRKQMTVIVITHARDMMAIAERIVMLDKGRVVETGTFSELKRKRGGAFGRLLRGEKEEQD
ncbi:multidrug resistance protein-like protein 2 [Dothidotthia symphoricarpi CBS 119687]|uniref:Multidrug resistance protein-like protein 2 n=1 Tax=Dothidotthia symphoricarpi CBS 119687 TaxID=1392245 RepID=A0A6A6AM39_9PLEO|nr:multidrug resistance protein-like protein 2 [Dothidotthia symphoricarpi CBS 119687]KAF2131947.1 multidrug resistance protein-like protein 2 [Dothidotthia symphoricarpi CBS 119687]